MSLEEIVVGIVTIPLFIGLIIGIGALAVRAYKIMRDRAGKAEAMLHIGIITIYIITRMFGPYYVGFAATLVAITGILMVWTGSKIYRKLISNNNDKINRYIIIGFLFPGYLYTLAEDAAVKYKAQRSEDQPSDKS